MRFFIQWCNGVTVNAWEHPKGHDSFDIWVNVTPTIYQACFNAESSEVALETMRKICHALLEGRISRQDLYTGDVNSASRCCPDLVKFAEMLPAVPRFRLSPWRPTA